MESIGDIGSRNMTYWGYLLFLDDRYLVDFGEPLQYIY